MAIKDFLKKLVPKVGEEPKESVPENNGENCAYCQGNNPDKKWMGQLWHKDCLRKAKKMAKKMI